MTHIDQLYDLGLRLEERVKRLEDVLKDHWPFYSLAWPRYETAYKPTKKAVDEEEETYGLPNENLSSQDKFLSDLEELRDYSPEANEVEKRSIFPFRLQNRYQDSGWEDLNESYANVCEAITIAYTYCQDAVCYGMVRVVWNDKVVVEFPAGGFPK
jgi:hypothetical protein